MDSVSIVFAIVEIILVPAYVGLYMKYDRLTTTMGKTRENLLENVSELRTEMLKDFATKQELATSISALTISIQNLEAKIDKLNDTLLLYFKKDKGL